MASRVLQTFPLGMPWPTVDPFLFVAHHRDAYPAGDGRLGPDASLLEGRSLGQDFGNPSGWSMYHGTTVPGFPAHPHRGFETVTYVRSGLCDHADSLGAAARFGRGDTQWITTGAGLVHSEMFPLVHRDRENPLDLFQIWLNLPSSAKAAEPHFAMLWSEDTPTVRLTDDAGRGTEVVVLAGAFAGAEPAAPPPDSWAADPDHDVAIWHLDVAASAGLTLPAAAPGTARVLYVFDGSSLLVDGEEVPSGQGALVDATSPLPVAGGADGAQVLVLQGRPIGEPVAQYGPFVLNDEAGIRRAFEDYRRTGFGGWPWDRDDPDHGGTAGRFARYPDGRVEQRDDAGVSTPAG